jgi:DNA-binding transcriptional LysR family regulator
MTLNQLRVFAGVCRQKSITRAAEVLKISEPSVFQQVKSLEEWFGVKLYRKVGRGIELTRQGREVEAEIDEVLAKLDKLAGKFKVIATNSAVEDLVIGSDYAHAVEFLPSLIARFKKTHPLIQMTLKTNGSKTIEHLILHSEVDIGLITRPSNSPELHTIPYRAENYIAFISAKHPFAKKAEWTMADVAQCPLIVRNKEISKCTSYLREMGSAGLQPNVFMQCESAESIKLAVLNGMGLGFLYEDHVKSEIKQRKLKIVKIEGFNPPDVQSFIVLKKNHALSQNGKTFLSLLAGAADNRIVIEQFPVIPE